jgi:hypothetical protein
MKAILIVFMPGQNGQAVVEQSLALRSTGISQLPIDLNHAQNRFRQLQQSEERTAPFWTWFIENPRQARA